MYLHTDEILLKTGNPSGTANFSCHADSRNGSVSRRCLIAHHPGMNVPLWSPYEFGVFTEMALAYSGFFLCCTSSCKNTANCWISWRAPFYVSWKTRRFEAMFPAYAHLSAYDRHKKLVNDYLTFYGKSVSSYKRDTSRDKTDYDVIKENHKFLWDQEKDIPDTWGAKLAKKYYDKLFKEYCICDLTYYKYNKVALRWRTEKEVIVGKGQFECGSKTCKEKENLRSWELNFGYVEHGEKKNALVKLRLCPECSVKLNYRSQKREVKARKSLKRLGTNSESNNDAPTVSSNSESANKAEIDSSSVEVQSENTDTNESNIWKEKQAEDVEKTREKEFEEYLADLLM